jgi:hypothetical protein
VAYPSKIETLDSASGGLSTQDDGTLQREVNLKWLVPNMADYTAAETKGIELAPLEMFGHRRNRLDVRSIGSKWYEIAATYGTLIPEKEETGDDTKEPVANTISFDTTGGTEHITQSFATWDMPDELGVKGSQTGQSGQARYKVTGDASALPDLEGAINVEGDQVKGIDIVVPQFNFSETWVFPASYLVNSYIATLYELTGTNNHDKWRVFEPGEVLFMGARGDITRGAAAAAITFSFAARPNRSNFKVGGVDVNGKMGWEQMSVMYETAASSSTIFRKPKFVIINTVYRAKDFARLQIGNTFPAIYPPKTPKFKP